MAAIKMIDADAGSLSPFACVMEAIEASRRQEHLANARYLFNRVLEIRELADGFGFKLERRPDLLTRLAEFIDLERRCCRLQRRRGRSI